MSNCRKWIVWGQRALIACAASWAASQSAITYAQTWTWDGESGGSNGWSHAQNWDPNGVPASNGGATILMAGDERLNPDVDAPWDIRSLTFDPTAGEFHLVGEQLTIRADGITNNDTGTQYITNPIRLGTNQTWTAAAGPLELSAPVRPGDADTLLTISGGFNTTLSNAVRNAAMRTISIVKNGTGTLLLSGDNEYSGNTTVNAGTIVMTQTYRVGSAWTVASGAKAAMTPRSGGGPAKTLQVDFLSVSATGTLDMADNDLVVDNGVFTTIQSLVLSAFGNTTGGITSSTSNGTQILALFDNALLGNGQWNGETIGNNAVVGKYTYFGDANLDGQVSGDDYTVLDANLGTDPVVGMEWLSGDANLDGIVTGDDYTVIDANLGLGQGNPLSSSSVVGVPEPSGYFAAGAISLTSVLASRRRRSIAPASVMG